MKQGWEHLYSDRVPATIKEISESAEEALSSTSLQNIIMKTVVGNRANLISRLQHGGSRI